MAAYDKADISTMSATSYYLDFGKLFKIAHTIFIIQSVISQENVKLHTYNSPLTYIIPGFSPE